MKIKVVILTLLVTSIVSSGALAQGFLKKLANKASNAGSDLIVKKTGEQAEKAIDGKKAKDVKEEKKTEAISESNSSGSVTAYSKFDFVPGNQILLLEDFEQDAIGEFPLKWFTKGGGEIVTLKDLPGKWLATTGGAALSPIIRFPENFTVEFDVFLNISANSSSVLPGLSFQFFDGGEKLRRLDAYNYPLNNIMMFSNSFNYQRVIARLDSREKGKVKLLSDPVSLAGFQRNYGSVVHVSMAVQKERVRLWYNEQKVMDIPIAVALNHNFNQMYILGNKKADGSPGFYFSNLKIAHGDPDLRQKLEQGKFVTSDILFDSNSAQIKPSSYGLLKQLAQALKENPSKFKIVGHTDNVGGTTDNLSLSKRRAEAVRELLVREFGIDGGRLQTDGKGALQPVADNKSGIGRAQNRRVEFIKSS